MPYALPSEFGTPLMPQPWRHEKTPGVCADCYSAQLMAENVSGTMMAADTLLIMAVLGPYIDFWSNASTRPRPLSPCCRRRAP
mmetsp:Transcript_49492/g.160393  ORF Transcript_49492/g.160393 Transcript_49492/m.160393 type:complete len:83 (-) Transcript_49492:3898-4146(-)